MLCSLVPFQSVPPGPQGWRPQRSGRTRAEGQQDGSQALGECKALGLAGDQGQGRSPSSTQAGAALTKVCHGYRGPGGSQWWRRCCCPRLTGFVHSWTDSSTGDPKMPSLEGPTWVREGWSNTSGRLLGPCCALSHGYPMPGGFSADSIWVCWLVGARVELSQHPHGAFPILLLSESPCPYATCWLPSRMRAQPVPVPQPRPTDCRCCGPTGSVPPARAPPTSPGSCGSRCCLPPTSPHTGWAMDVLRMPFWCGATWGAAQTPPKCLRCLEASLLPGSCCQSATGLH